MRRDVPVGTEEALTEGTAACEVQPIQLARFRIGLTASTMVTDCGGLRWNPPDLEPDDAAEPGTPLRDGCLSPGRLIFNVLCFNSRHFSTI